MSYLIRNSRKQTCISSRASPWEYHQVVPHDTPPSEESTAWRRSSFQKHRHPGINPSVPSKTVAATDLIDICLNSGSLLRR